MNMTEDFNTPRPSGRPKIRWWLPSTLTDQAELEREMVMLREAGFGGAEIAAGYAIDPHTKKDEKGWGQERWGEQIRSILRFAKEQDFEIDLMVIPSGKLMIDVFSDVDDPTQGVRLELDGESIGGITQNNPYQGLLPVSEEAIRDAKAVNGTCALYAVTVAKYVDKEKNILSLESAKELKIGTDVIQNGGDPLSYTVSFTPEDEGEYVLFAWWQHPSGENQSGIPQFDFLGKYGTKRFLQYHEEEFLPKIGNLRGYITSYFNDSIEWETHLDFVVGFRELFMEKFGFDITKYLPALYEKNFWGTYRHPRPDFSFDQQNEQLIRCYGEFLTHLYIENHLKPMGEFCHRNGFTFRAQTSYGKFLELEQTAGYVDIPDTETLYGKDILDFYRAQAGAAHITGKQIYSIEASAETHGRGNGEENSGMYAQGFKRQMWHLQRAYAAGVNQVYFHGCMYRGNYSGEGNENGVLPGTHWPGAAGLGFVGGCANGWDDRQPNWQGMRQLTDCLSRIQQVLQEGQALVDLAIYRHSYQEVLDSFHPEKLLPSSVPEQLGYSYDFISPAHLSGEDIPCDGESLFCDGPRYQALIFHRQTHLPTPVLRNLKVLAKQGLPIIFCGGAPRDGSYFGEKSAPSDMEEILRGERVRVCSHIEQIPDILASLRVTPRVAYREPAKVLNAYRRAENADYIYFYHYADADTHPEMAGVTPISFTVNLRTNGTPYILDPWTGSITEAAVVGQDRNGLSVNLRLAPNDSRILIIASPANGQPPIHTEPRKTILREQEFELKNWTLTVESWTAGDTPLETKKKPVKKAELDEPLFFTQIDGMEAVSGVGCYTAEFHMEKGWEEGFGAYLVAHEIEDCYTIEVNGTQIPANQTDPCVDIGRYLRKGKNHVKISVYSTLLNAAIAYCQDHGISHNGRCKDYGMNGAVRVIPYIF